MKKNCLPEYLSKSVNLSKIENAPECVFINVKMKNGIAEIIYKSSYLIIL